MSPERKIARIERALEKLGPNARACRLCPRRCGADRERGETGVCGIGGRARVASALLHYGEEPVLSGLSDCGREPGSGPARRRGSGTVFFSGCSLRCSFCQNHQISWDRRGRDAGDDELAGFMLDLRDRGALNINLVSPTHVLLPILRALRIAYGRGLDLPLVYNTNGYELVEVVERLAGIVDVYLPDLKYRDPAAAGRYAAAPDYFVHASTAVQEMFGQQPDLVLDGEGIARRGLIVRHLILPGQAGDSAAILEWLAGRFPATLTLSLMSQYRPCHRAPREIRRPLRAGEYRRVLDRARELGFESLFLQPEVFGPGDHLVPDFDRPEPFRWRPRRAGRKAVPPAQT